jgi:hypothetical protein
MEIIDETGMMIESTRGGDRTTRSTRACTMTMLACVVQMTRTGGSEYDLAGARREICSLAEVVDDYEIEVRLREEKGMGDMALVPIWIPTSLTYDVAFANAARHRHGCATITLLENSSPHATPPELWLQQPPSKSSSLPNPIPLRFPLTRKLKNYSRTKPKSRIIAAPKPSMRVPNAMKTLSQGALQIAYPVPAMEVVWRIESQGTIRHLVSQTAFPVLAQVTA